eukprot:960066-Amphidinium_carterae.1
MKNTLEQQLVTNHKQQSFLIGSTSVEGAAIGMMRWKSGQLLRGLLVLRNRQCQLWSSLAGPFRTYKPSLNHGNHTSNLQGHF